MEDDFAWLAAGLIFLGIIVQHDARAATPLAEPQLQDRAVIIRPILLWPEYLDTRDCRASTKEDVRADRPFANLQINRKIQPQQQQHHNGQINRGMIALNSCADNAPRSRAILASGSARVH